MVLKDFAWGALSAAALAAGIFSGTAQAFLITNTGMQAGNPPGDLYEVKISSTDVNSSFDIFWNVPSSASSALTHDLAAEMTVSVDAFTSTTLDLSIAISNTTLLDGGFKANILSFGFGVDPDVVPSFLTSGTTFVTVADGQGGQQSFPGGFKGIDVCAFAANNCSGGSVNDGLAIGASDSMQIRLTGAFGSDPMAILMGFPLKFQTDEGSYEPAGAVVPVPAAVWLFGSGLIGLVGLARRKKAA
ncbi:putative secreted protein [Thiogranum longum]|uniref:Putative secreted protein n=1 Tax=Thiogranum longum TaxID=1537524 RepID=A0A4R1HDA8_9GAMM|nr:cistern family PEP-CTERM protein [Thiogranum longum]TCK19498.1 putative secreted protein [Thiogranum longum]